MPFHTHTLPNGLQLVGETIPSARSAAVGFFVKTGSRDETSEVAGVSHFLEHMVFKGTPRRTALDVNLDFDRIGANYNAYTSEENTVYYAAVLPEYLPDVVDILADVLRPSLRGEDFDTEKQVILEEIKMYEDAPGSMAWDHARRIYYADHPLGNTILGSTASVGALSRDQMMGYFGRRVRRPEHRGGCGGELRLAGVRAARRVAVRPLARDAGRPGPRPRGPRQGRGPRPDAADREPGARPGDEPRFVGRVAATVRRRDPGDRRRGRLRQPAVLGAGGPGACRVGFVWHRPEPGVRHDRDLVLLRPGRGRGQPRHRQQILDDVQRDGITAEELTQAKNKIASRVVRHSERPMGRMRAIASSWIYCQEYSDVDRELARFDAVSLETIREYLDRYPINEATVVEYGPIDLVGWAPPTVCPCGGRCPPYFCTFSVTDGAACSVFFRSLRASTTTGRSVGFTHGSA